MSVMIQVRHVPDDIHRRLKARAAMEGSTLSDWVLKQLEQALMRPTLDDLWKRIDSASPPPPGLDPTAAVRADRDAAG